MKIALCTRKFIPPLVGGVDVYADRLGQALKRLGHEVIVLAFDSNPEVNSTDITVLYDNYNGFDVWRLKFAFDQRPKEAFDLGYDPEMGQVIKNVLREQAPDLLIILNFYMVTLASVEAAKALGIPVIHIATDFLPICRRATFVRWDGTSCQVGESIKSCAACFVSHRVAGRLAASLLDQLPEEILVRVAISQINAKPPQPLWLLKPYWQQVNTMDQRLKILGPLRKKIDLVLTPTQYTAHMFISNGFEPDQVHLLPFAIEPDHPLANIERVPASHTRFLFVGRLQPYKGAHLLIEAFNKLENPKGATLTIYGASDGYDDYFNNLKAMMAANERIRFAGKIPPTELGKAFAEADFFILPSTWHENSPLIILDALQSKTPVIASEIGGVTDMVKHEVNGLLFPMGDKKALQEAMQRVIDQPEVGEQLRAGVNLLKIDDYVEVMLKLCRDRVNLPATNETKVFA